MALEVYWTQNSENLLYEIFEYYKDIANEKVVDKIIDGLVSSTINFRPPDATP